MSRDRLQAPARTDDLNRDDPTQCIRRSSKSARLSDPFGDLGFSAGEARQVELAVNICRQIALLEAPGVVGIIIVGVLVVPPVAKARHQAGGGVSEVQRHRVVSSLIDNLSRRRVGVK